MALAFCTHCGRPLKEGDRFCTNCGTPVQDAPASRQEQLQSAKPAAGDTAVMSPVRDPDDSPASDAFSGARSSESAGSGKAVSTKTAVLIITAVAAVIVVAALILIHPWAHDNAIPATSSSASQETAASMANGEQGAESASSSSGSSSSTHAHSASKGKGSSRSSSYRLTTKTAGGQTLTGTVHRTAGDEVIPHYTTKYYTEKQIRAMHLNNAELCIALNEPLAHQGRHFKNSAIRDYFNSCSWYVDKGYSEVELDGAAEHNYEIVIDLIEERGSAYRWDEAVLR